MAFGCGIPEIYVLLVNAPKVSRFSLVVPDRYWYARKSTYIHLVRTRERFALSCSYTNVFTELGKEMRAKSLPSELK